MFGFLKNTAQKMINGVQRVDGPDNEWIKGSMSEHPLTPDVWVLGQFEYQLVFMYGTSQRGHAQHDLVSSLGAFAATTYTDDRFTLWKKRLGTESYPIALQSSGWKRPDWNTPAKARVQGELYAVPRSTIYELDKHYRNTLWFERVRVPLVLPYKELYEIVGGTPIQQKIHEALGRPALMREVTSEIGIKLVRAWMYIGKPDYWDDQLGHHFTPVKQYHSRVGWLGDYVAFTKEDYVK